MAEGERDEVIPSPHREKKLRDMNAAELRSYAARVSRNRLNADKMYWPVILEQLRRSICKHKSWEAARYIECELREMKDTEVERLFDYWSPLDLHSSWGDSLLGGAADDDLNELVIVCGEVVKSYSQTVHLNTAFNYVYYIDLQAYKAISIEEFDS